MIALLDPGVHCAVFLQYILRYARFMHVYRVFSSLLFLLIFVDFCNPHFVEICFIQRQEINLH